MRKRTATSGRQKRRVPTATCLYPPGLQKRFGTGCRRGKGANAEGEAAAGAAFVVAMVRDDEASRMVWLDANKGALGGMAAGAVAIESSTLTPGWVRELGHAVAERGVALQEAPVSGSRLQADAGQLVYFRRRRRHHARGDGARTEGDGKRCLPCWPARLQRLGEAEHERLAWPQEHRTPTAPLP